MLFSDAPVKISELCGACCFFIITTSSIFISLDRSTLALRGEWKGLTAGGAPPLHTWRNNPQYFLIPYKPLSCVVTLTQRESVPVPISVFVTRSSAAQAAGHRMLQLRNEDIIARAGPEAKRSLSFDLSLDRSAAPFVLVPCCSASGVEGEFLLTIESKDPETPLREALNVVPCN